MENKNKESLEKDSRPQEQKISMQERKVAISFAPKPEHLSTNTLIKEILSLVPVERIEKLKLLSPKSELRHSRVIDKRVDELTRETGLNKLREKVQECNTIAAHPRKAVNHE